MKLKVLSPLPAKYRNTFVVEVKFMFGDAVHYRTEEFVIEWEDKTIEFVELLNRLKKNYIPDFEKDVDPSSGPFLFENWPYDTKADRGAYFNGYKVFFYDVNGNKCPVQVTK